MDFSDDQLRCSDTSAVDTECSSDEESNVQPPSPPVDIAFSASAGMFIYQMGVAAFIQDHFDLSNCHFSGCLGGSWTATLLTSDTPVRRAWEVIKAAQVKVITTSRWYSGYGRYVTIVEQTSHELWREDTGIHKRDLDDHIGSIVVSSVVPFALSGKPRISHRGQWYVDGAFTNFKGVDCDEYSTWADLSFHTAQTVLDCARSASTAITGFLIPGAWGKNAVNKVFNAIPMLPSPHDTIAPSSSTPSSQMKRLIIKPWNWRSQSMPAFHLSVGMETHEEHFATEYKDAQQHFQELGVVLSFKK